MRNQTDLNGIRIVLSLAMMAVGVILILLFACLSAFGQNGQTESEIALIEWDDNGYYSKGGSVPVGRGVIIDSAFLFSDFEHAPNFRLVGDSVLTFDVLIFLSDFIAYETERYNDSTLIRAYVPYTCGDPYCLVMHERYRHVEYWIHREPTFKGFIQWLKSRQ